MIQKAQWIGIAEEIGEVCPEFYREFRLEGEVKSAQLTVSAIGVYEAYLNGERIGDHVLAPGCTAFKTRLQYQTYDVTGGLKQDNTLSVIVGRGWHRGRISESSPEINQMPCGMILALKIEYAEGKTAWICSDSSFSARTTGILSSDIYDGECYDASVENFDRLTVKELELSKERLIPEEGCYVREQERLIPCRLIKTPKGETVIDFGQNFAGYPEITLTAKKGDRVRLSVAEILDKDGNVYTENYRSAKAGLTYICRDGVQTYKPHFTFYGFRYIRVDEFPGEVTKEAFRGIAIYSNVERRGYLTSGNGLLNRLYENVLWSQRSNFVDIPTDCPQRDERMGWLGDAQVFAKTAGYNYDVYVFFRKWLADLRAEQRADGSVPDTTPNFWRTTNSSAAWADAVCVIPWQMYLLYGDPAILRENFGAMKKWVDYITGSTAEEFLWISTGEELFKGGKHYGDWLALDAPYGSYKGKTDEHRIATAFYYYSTSLVVKAGKAIGQETEAYERLMEKIRSAYRKKYPGYETQTDCVLDLYFDLAADRKKCADRLAEMIGESGGCLQTGFVGTPYLLYALSENGYTKLAYDLLLNEKNPSWFYEVLHGATTIWEHWDGVNDEGKIWSKNMNSYNHYAYGAVMDWVYSFAAGVQTCEENPGFGEAVIAPHPDRRLGFLEARVETRQGTIVSRWVCEKDCTRYEITVPARARIRIGDREEQVEAGRYLYTVDEG